MRFLVLLVGAALAAGCTQNPSTGLSVAESDPAVQALNEAALRVARAAEQSALAESVKGRKSHVTEEYRIDLSAMPPEMREPLLLERGFHGEMETLIKSLADAVNWPAPVILGVRPATPLMVTMTEQRRPPIYWIADAGYQVGELADITVRPDLRQITITYKEAGGVR